jgi:hypothetical protein
MQYQKVEVKEVGLGGTRVRLKGFEVRENLLRVEPVVLA